MKNILPTELKIEQTKFSKRFIVRVTDNEGTSTIICAASSQHKEIIKLMVKLYNEYQKKQGK